MSGELDEVARALFNGQIPAIWRKLAPDTLKSLGNWMIHFKRRHEQYITWVRKLLSYCLKMFFLSGFKVVLFSEAIQSLEYLLIHYLSWAHTNIFRNRHRQLYEHCN